MGVFIKFKILELINFVEKKKYISLVLYYKDFVLMETDYKRNTIRIYTKTDIVQFENVIIKSLEIINENGVKI